MNKNIILSAVAVGLLAPSVSAMQSEVQKKKSWTTTNKLIAGAAGAGALAVAYNKREALQGYATEGYAKANEYGAQAVQWAKGNPYKAATYGAGAALGLYLGYRWLTNDDSAQDTQVPLPDSAERLFAGRPGSKFEQDERKKYPEWLAGNGGLVDLLRAVYPQDAGAKTVQPLVNKAFNNPHVLLSEAKLLNDMNAQQKEHLMNLCALFLEEQLVIRTISLLDSLTQEQAPVHVVLSAALESGDPLNVITTMKELAAPHNGLAVAQRNIITDLIDLVELSLEQQKCYLDEQGMLSTGR